MEEISQKIKKARLEQDITLEEVHQETKIRKRYLEAIEEGDMELIAQKVFLKGFLRVYADYVGLDGLQILQEFNQLLALQDNDKEAETAEVTEEQSEDDLVEDILSVVTKHLAKIAVSTGLIVIVAVGLLFYNSGILGKVVDDVPDKLNNSTSESEELVLTDDNEEELQQLEQKSNQFAQVDELESTTANSKSKQTTIGDDSVEKKESNNTQEETSQSQLERSSQESSSSEAKTLAEETPVTVKTIEDSWIKVIIDGKVVLEDLLSSGAEESWQADQQAKLLIGNAAGVKVLMGDKDLGPFGQHGEVVEKEFQVKAN
ncbi:MAG: helix-turn-helix domain-containing protein [Bacillota bacterium]